MMDEIDMTGKPGAEVAESLKRSGPALDASADSHENGESPAHSDHSEPEETLDREQIDEAVGKLWKLGWGIAARRMENDELREERENVEQAKDALGPLARKYFRRTLERGGPEAVASLFLLDTAERKYAALEPKKSATPHDG